MHILIDPREVEKHTINRQASCLHDVENLYKTAFPEAERLPWEKLFYLQEHTDIDFFGYFEEEKFLGLTYTFNRPDISWLFYFAVTPDMRGKGIGTRILADLLANHPHKPLLIDIEDAEQPADDTAQRLRRLTFYKRMGFTDYGIRKTWEPIRYNIMAHGGTITIGHYESLVNDLATLMGWNK